MDDSRHTRILSYHGVKAKREKYISIGIVVKIKNTMTYRKDIAPSATHAHEVLQIIIRPLVYWQLAYKRQKLQLPSYLLCHIIGMDESHKLLLPDGHYLLCPIAQTQSLAEMPVADVAGIERHVAQHGNGVFGHTIMSGHNFCLVISFKKLLVRGECMVQQLIVQLFVFTLCPYCSQFCMVFVIFLFRPATLSLIQRKNG